MNVLNFYKVRIMKLMLYLVEKKIIKKQTQFTLHQFLKFAQILKIQMKLS